MTAVLLAASVLTAAGASAAPRAVRGTSVSVVTGAGQTTAVQRALTARGFRVDRRSGRRLQVVVRRRAQRQAIAALPGVATVVQPPTAYGDLVTSQGVERTGASALIDAADGGAGLRIAVLDLGFGTAVPGLQTAGELPPASRVVAQSFDPAGGLIGTNAYGGPTDHGQLVAQTIYDYAPRASYWFVSYHTPDDFVAAVDWLVTQDVDLVVHSNNFLDGPFDGTSAVARAVDRAAASGILWFNSAGNYGEKHWMGEWRDPDGDGALDWPSEQPWTMVHEPNHALTFHVSWTTPTGAPKSDIDLILDQRQADGSWKPLATSADKQMAGVPSSERIAGVRPGVLAEYRLRAVLVAGPPPAGLLHLYSREDDILSWSGSALGSVPTPADAAGSISVGAIAFRGNSLARYSSHGPTADGRLKPEISAPTGTSLATEIGDPRDVGGTSIAAPNAAGAAALLLGAMRRSGLQPTVAEVRAILMRDALDLGDPGPDPVFGAGRLRVDVDAPVLRTVVGIPARPVRGNTAVAVEAIDAGQVATWAFAIDGAHRREGRAGREVINVSFGTRDLVDGPHTVDLDVGDAVGNLARRTWKITVDNTAAKLAIAPVVVSPSTPALVAGRRVPTHRVGVTVTGTDAGSRTLSVDVAVRKVSGGPTATSRVTIGVGVPHTIGLGRLTRGVYTVRISATDAAGNRSTAIQRFLVAAVP